MVCGNYSFGASSNVSDTKTHIGIIGYLSPSLSYYLVVLQIQNNQKSLYYTKLIVIIIVIFRNNYISKISHTIAPICYTLTLRSNWIAPYLIIFPFGFNETLFAPGANIQWIHGNQSSRYINISSHKLPK